MYLVCLLGGLLPIRDSEISALHHKIFELMPGFEWLSIGSFILGAVYVFVFSWAIAWYMVWMYNSSLVEQR